MKNEKHNIGSIIIIIIVILLLLSAIGSCSDDTWEENEKAAFENQMSKYPNTWSDEEKDRYNDFIEWEDNN